MKTLLLLCTAALLLSCSSSGKMLKPTSNSATARQTIMELLTERGFACHLNEDDVQCEAERTYKVLMEYRQRPPRLFLFAWFDTNGKTCEQLAPTVISYNATYPTQAACIEEERGTSLRFFASTLVPESGLTARELEEYLGFWSGFIHDSAYESGLFEKDAKDKPEQKPLEPVTPS